MHSNIFFTRLNFTLLCFCPLCLLTTAQADVDETYHLSVGTNLAIFDTDVSLSSRDDSIGSDVDLEDDLNYDKEVNTSWISGWYRVGDNHRLKLTYIPIRRSAFLQNTKDIVVDDTTIKSGAFISSESKSEVFDFSYIYSLHHSPQLEVGFSAGIYWLLTDTSITAAGEIQADGDDQPIFRSDYFTQQKLQAPMPLFGFTANYEFSNNWRAHATLRYLSVQINDIDGEIISAELAAEYYFSNNWGIGLALSSFNLDVSTENIISNASLGWSQNGTQVYAIFKY